MLEQTDTVKKKKMSITATAVLTIICIIVVIAGIVVLLRSMGKEKMTTPAVVTDKITNIGDKADDLKENQISYKDKIYALNEDLTTILVMGIDDETYTEVGGNSWSAEEGSYYNGGQADALFLILLNPHMKKTDIIAVNRNAMADIDVWDETGNYEGIFKKQICLQHGYGYGGTESCEYQVKAVSRMFHNISIDAYAAISMDAIPELNDAVGGIEVEVLDDIIYPEYDMNLHQGDVVTLSGEKAYWYIRLRNENVFDSSEQRLQRQKQYLTTFLAKAKSASVSDVRTAAKLYKIAQKYMVTDIDAGSCIYLATEASGYTFDMEDIYSLKGETIQGNRFEEFYVDEDALEELIVELFYEPVEK